MEFKLNSDERNIFANYLLQYLLNDLNLKKINNYFEEKYNLFLLKTIISEC